MIRVCAASFSSRVMLPSTYAREALVPTALVGMLLLREARERLGQPGPFPECSAGTCRLCQLRFRDLLPLRHAHLLLQRPGCFIAPAIQWFAISEPLPWLVRLVLGYLFRHRHVLSCLPRLAESDRDCLLLVPDDGAFLRPAMERAGLPLVHGRLH